MVRAHIERIINIPISDAWPILADFSHVHKIHPLVANVDQISPNDRGVDAERTCHFYDGGNATERVVEWDEATHKYTVKLLSGTLPMKSVIATLQAVKVDESRTKLIGDMEMIAKFGLLGKIMERLIIKPQLGKAVGNLFAGVEHYAKTGDEVQKGFQAPTPALVK